MLSIEEIKLLIEKLERVKKEDLQEMVHDKCMDKVMGWDFYELATRPGAKDLFTKVKTIDLCHVGKIKKKV